MKEKKIIFILLAAISALLILYFVLGRSEKAPVVKSDQKQSRYRTKIEGLSFLAMNNGRKTIAIHADRFIVQNMKVGYFTFSMAAVAFLENVSIDVYNTYEKGKGRIQKAGQQELSDEKNKNDLDFKKAFSRESFVSFPVQKIASIVAAPIVFTLYDGEAMITRISAKKANLRFRKNDVLFNGEVRVVSGKKEMTCESLRLLPADGVMEAKKYRMAGEGKNTHGSNLKTDLLLERHM